MLSPAEVADFHRFIYKWPHYYFFFLMAEFWRGNCRKAVDGTGNSAYGIAYN
jgi:hypothetical protein